MSQEVASAMPQQTQTINVNVGGVGAGYTTLTSDKKKMTALLLCIFLGGIGGHLFYVGRIGKGILYLCTGGLCAIGVIIDLISIANGGFKDNAGAALRK